MVCFYGYDELTAQGYWTREAVFISVDVLFFRLKQMRRRAYGGLTCLHDISWALCIQEPANGGCSSLSEHLTDDLFVLNEL